MNYGLHIAETSIECFFIFDNNNIVVLFNGFNKKSQTTPINEKEKALRIRENYYADKRSQNQKL